jgi:EamA domain-containing membrane protein RarD
VAESPAAAATTTAVVALGAVKQGTYIALFLSFSFLLYLFLKKRIEKQESAFW